ncbi:extracellular solute-binding protein [Paenibacillus qinlingensis]|uniref:Aldouronate transport system substrate-binding protein n=1 Tax=Paenibacillus qinlingensis TaxID=1837343 RepID=A0ABU1NW94_9BACL|nr:extracellular solute-binding protein [Paenibacillus qinlingensis]MDR6551723.1 putative aldouronate transport system substrate-binding protein [Paenibacillus qinlingensis]
MVVKKWLSLTVAVSTLVISACSNTQAPKTADATNSPSVTGTPQATASAAPVDDKSKKLTITFMSGMSGVVPPNDGAAVKLINEKFNVDYKVTLFPRTDATTKINTTLAAGDMPDILNWDGPNLNNYGQLAKQGAFLPLDDFIKDYPSMQIVPDYVWDAMRINGKIYSIPRYFPVQYGATPIIRKDWLDKLNLKMPTTYEELKQVAIAFTTKDPDGNGKNDTFGIMMQSPGPSPDLGMGAYWKPDAWYHKNKDGLYIPGVISDTNKELSKWIGDVYKSGAIFTDWAVTNSAEAKKQFFAGKAGIYLSQPYDVGPASFTTMRGLFPTAELAAIPPFKAPDGSQSYLGQPGWSGRFVLNAKLKDDPAKVRRILSMLEYFRTFIPVEKRNADNKDYDWLLGGKDVGYKVVDGKILSEWGKGLSPIEYLEDRFWAPSDEANEVTKAAAVTDPLQKMAVTSLEQMHKDTKVFINPVNRVASETFNAKFWTNVAKFNAEVTKMIYGQRSFDDWDKIVAEFLADGGTQMIKEVNDEMVKGKVVPEFK